MIVFESSAVHRLSSVGIQHSNSHLATSLSSYPGEVGGYRTFSKLRVVGRKPSTTDAFRDHQFDIQAPSTANDVQPVLLEINVDKNMQLYCRNVGNVAGRHRLVEKTGSWWRDDNAFQKCLSVLNIDAEFNEVLASGGDVLGEGAPNTSDPTADNRSSQEKLRFLGQKLGKPNGQPLDLETEGTKHIKFCATPGVINTVIRLLAYRGNRVEPKAIVRETDHENAAIAERIQSHFGEAKVG
jgi:hypothetical protein